MKSYRRWSILCLGSCCALLLALGLCNFVIDPFQHYRKATLYRPYFKKPRNLNPGVARNYPYDTVVLGTSMVQNFRAASLREKLGFDSVKLAIPGGSGHEQRLTLDVALRTGKVRNVVVGLDIFSFAGAPERFRFGAAAMPLHLYDENPFNDLNYLLSADTLAFYKYLIRANLLDRETDKTVLDNFGYWGDKKKYRFSREAVLDDWREQRFDNELGRDAYRPETLLRSFEENLLSLMRDHQEIEFIVFYPPYSALVWADLLHKGTLEDALAFKRRTFELTRDLDNVKLFDFQPLTGIITDLDNYKDISHYGPHINELMVDAFARDEHRVREADLDRQLAILRETAARFSQLY